MQPPAIDANPAGKEAINEFDANHDGAIDGAELDKVPGIKGSIGTVDTNGDHRVTPEEVSTVIQGWQASRLAAKAVMAEVTINGKPVVDAEVKFIPEKFLGPNLKPAKGTTNAQGMANMSIENLELNGTKLSGVACGFYRVEISKVVGGAETIPKRFNSESELGVEVSPHLPYMNLAKFDLTPK